MACFLAPMAIGIMTTLFRNRIPATLKISWLNLMLWGGIVMLIIDHLASGEFIFYPPFLTAMQNPANILVMLQEITIIGGLMTISIVVVWIILVAITLRIPQVSKQVE